MSEPETTNYFCPAGCGAVLTTRTAAAHGCGAGTGEYTDPDQCSDCGRRPVVIRESDDSIRWCQGCVDQAEWESAMMAEEHDECSLVRACRQATEQESVEPLRDWVEAWTGERP